MNRQEQVVLLALAALAVTGGFIKIKTENNGNDTSVIVNSALRRKLADVTSGKSPANNWTCPEWSIKSVGADTLRSNHSLFRRPKYIGENRHAVMTGGWDNWYYDPPGEEYF
jgi:hypothetical protein